MSIKHQGRDKRNKNGSVPCLSYEISRGLFYSKNFYNVFIISFLILFITCAQAHAQTFMFVDETGAKVTSGFTFVKNLKNDISFSARAPLNKFYFRQSLSFEEPAATGYSFQSENYSIDTAKTGGDTLDILAGKEAAPVYSVNMVYLKNKKNAASSSGSSKAYGFGGNITAATPGAAGQTFKNTAAQTAVPATNKPAALTNNKNTLAGSTSVKPPAAAVTNPATIKPATATLTYPSTVKPATATATYPAGVTPVIIKPATVDQPAVTAKNTAAKRSVSLNLGTGGGSVSGIFMNSRGEPFPAESVVITVSNNGGTFTRSTIVTTNGTQTAYSFQIDGIPQILQGSTDSYKLTVVSNNSYTVNANLPSNIKIYGNGQNVYTQPITMAANRGRLNITLYHGPNSLTESDSMLLTLAQNAVMNISGFAVSCRFTGESPRHFYRYVIDDAPAGKWQLEIMFPGHGVSRQPSVWVPSNATATELFTLTETN